eukprot:scpid43655/ scgid31977/ Nuclear pore complex protein Nup85; 85 kDa nucleoporin; FROUNT; Nucleoporin Nup75; Nucleoporin Nup85; Pericentrin-1
MSQFSSSGDGGLGVKFSSGDRAVVYSSVCSGSPSAPVENRAATGGEREPPVHEVALSGDVSSVACGQLISECHAIFCALQEVGASTSSSRSNSLLHISRQYRAVLHACLINARHETARGVPTNGHGLRSASNEQHESVLFGNVELIWHLCEIIFLEVLPVGCVMQPLLEWVRWHGHHAQERARDLLSHPDLASVAGKKDDVGGGGGNMFWDTVYLLVLQGRIDTVRDLLARLPSRRASAAASAFSSLDELLRKMPVPQALFGQSLTEFSLRWKRWQQECRSRSAEGEFSAVPQLQHIAQIMSGDSTALQSCRPLCENWYEAMVGTLLYTNPTVKAVDLQYSLTAFLGDGYGSAESPVDSILRSAFEYDIPAVIRQCGEHFAPLNHWMSAHLTDLLFHCGKLEPHNAEYGMDQREFLLVEFATSLMSHDSFWQTGISYLDHCGSMGGPYLDLLVPRVPLTSERKALKVLSICQQRDLTDAGNSVCRIMAMQAYRNGRLGSALNWCLRCKESSFAAFLADRLLSRYSADGVFEHLDLIDNLGPAMLLNNRLTFLAQYHQFHRHYNNQDFQQAGSLLFSLLDSRLAPKELWPTILLDALPLLELDEVIFDRDQTYELMYCLEEVQTYAQSGDCNGSAGADGGDGSGVSAGSRLNGFMSTAVNGDGGMDDDAVPMDTNILGKKQLPIKQLMDKLSLLRLALARNLARAIISGAHS